MIRRYELDNPFHHFHPTRFYDDNGKWYLVSDVDPIIAKLEAENEKLGKIIKIFEIQIIAARRANSLGLCKRALIHAVDDVNKIKMEG